MKLFRQPFNSQLDIASSSWLPSTDPSSRHPINDFEPSLNTASPLPAFPQLIDLVTECCKQQEIIKKCQEGEMSLRQGLMLAKKAQELLRSAPDEGLFSA
uniref:Uncharacterized protein n=1 Tax=Salix viminalis TaxID=40686 RepID=A0A6N2KJY2_SALVM